MSPDTITRILQAGASVDISNLAYGPQLVDNWVKLAVAYGGRITIGGRYAPDFFVQWATDGGSHVTIKPPANP